MILRTATAFRSRTPGVVNRFNKKSAKQVYNGRVNKLNVFVVSFFFSIVDSSINREPNEMFADRHPKWATQWKVPTSYPQNQFASRYILLLSNHQTHYERFGSLLKRCYYCSCSVTLLSDAARHDEDLF